MILASKVTQTSAFLDEQSPSKVFEYRIALLDNQAVRFGDAEPDISTMPITHLDLDPTEACNLRCSYCFKGKLRGRNMSLETAKQSVRFLVKYSGAIRNISVAMLGGEPLLAFPLMKKWVPWASRYCEQRGKKLNFQVTTNGTVFDQEHHDFFRYWHIGLHLSLDGCPEVQDQERKYADGAGSSKKVEQNLPTIFSAWRTVHARSTVVPETVAHLSESYRYFCEKGFQKVAFSLAHSDRWDNPATLKVLEKEFRKVLDYHWELMKKKKRYFILTILDTFVESQKNKEPAGSICGAARGSLHVDTEGILWPCHRFNGIKPHEYFVLGSIRGGFNNTFRNCFLRIDPRRDFPPRCATCVARIACLPTCVSANWQENDNLFDPGEGYCRAKQLLYKLCQEHAETLKKQEPRQWKKYTDWITNPKD